MTIPRGIRELPDAVALDWALPTLQARCAAFEPALRIEVLGEIDSTNSELLRRARAGDHTPTLLVAERQTLGRGRSGRMWHAHRGRSLTFSVGLVPALPEAPARWSGLSLAIGVGLAAALHPEVGLKWPNDLWWHDHKLGGILIETTQVATGRYAVIGVGLNVALPWNDELSPPGIGLNALLEDIDAPAALLRAAPAVLEAIQRFGREGLAGFIDEWHRRDVLADRLVQLSDGRQGVAAGIDADGALRLARGGRIDRIESAALSVRPVEIASGFAPLLRS